MAKVVKEVDQEVSKTDIQLNKTWFLLYRPDTWIYGDNDRYRKARSEKIPLQASNWAYGYDGRTVVRGVVFKDTFYGSLTGYAISFKCLKIISEEEANKLGKEFKDKMDRKNKEALAKLLPEPVAFTKRVVKEIATKKHFNTNYNWVHIGNLSADGKDINITSPRIAAACCAFTKCRQDLMVYIPRVWCAYYGYSKQDVMRWVDFIQKCGVEAETQFVGTAQHPSMMITDTFNEGAMIMPYNDNYLVSIRGKHHSILTYFNFIMLRYIYNMQYWNIPLTAMQIKSTLRDKVTHWQALLMAHLRCNYHGYYNFVAQTDNNKISVFDNEWKTLKPSLINNNGMNVSFKYVPYSQEKSNKLKDLFSKSDYAGVLELVKSIEKPKK